jgi:DNA-binding MarR family transcriptional regulator
METLPFEIGETAHALRKAFTRRAAAFGVTGAQWKVLFKLSLRPELRQSELAEILDIEPITLTRIIDRLEESGLVERVRDPSDRRAWQLHVTEAAQPLIKKLRGVAEELFGEAFAGIESQDLEKVRQVLTRIRENVSRSNIISKAANE